MKQLVAFRSFQKWRRFVSIFSTVWQKHKIISWEGEGGVLGVNFNDVHTHTHHTSVRVCIYTKLHFVLASLHRFHRLLHLCFFSSLSSSSSSSTFTFTLLLQNCTLFPCVHVRVCVCACVYCKRWVVTGWLVATVTALQCQYVCVWERERLVFKERTGQFKVLGIQTVWAHWQQC